MKLTKIIVSSIIAALLSFISVSSVAKNTEAEYEGLEVILKLAQQGDSNAQYLIASIYQQANDQNNAFKWFEKSALQGNEHSESKVGLMYYTGLGVRQNYSKAFEYSLKAANKGVEQSYIAVAAMYQMGQGVRQDNKKAKEWYGKSCDAGNQLGCDAYKELNEKGY